jgi:phage-related protein
VAVSILGEAAIRLRPNSEGFQAEAEAGIVGPLGAVAGKAAGLFAAAFAAEKVGEFLKDSVMQASDLSESTSKVGVVFGSASQQVLDFAANSASAFGQSKGQALEAAGTFGNLLRSIGMTADQSATMSTKMVGLASDLASFNNTDPAQALDALRAGLTGETEPLKQYGINLNDAALKQEALRLGLDASGPTLSASAKAQAAYSLILQQSTLAQGDFARTGGGLANQTRIMASQFADLKSNVGAVLVPFVTLGAHVITGVVMPALLGLTKPLVDVGAGLSAFSNVFMSAFLDTGEIGDLTANLGGLGREIASLAAEMGKDAAYFTDAFHGGDVAAAEADGTFSTMAAHAGQLANYWQAVGYNFQQAFLHGSDAAAQAESGLIGFANRTGSMFHGTVQSVSADWDSIKAAIGQAATPSLVQGVTVQFMSIKAGIGSALSGVGDTIRGAFAGAGGGVESGLGTALGGVGGFLRGLTDQAVGLIGQLGPKVLPFITGLVNQILPLIQQVVPIFTQVFQAIVPIVSQVFSTIGPLIAQVFPVIEQIAGLWRGVFMGAIEALLPVLPTIVTAIGQLISALVSGLAPIISALAPVISALVSAFQQGLINVITQLIPIIPPLVNVLTQVAQILVGALLGAIQAILPIIPTLIQLFSQVATMISGALMSVLQALLPILPPIVSALMQIAQALLGALMGALQAILPIIPQLIGVFVTLIQSAVLPLLPILPLLANLLATIISAIAPLIPVVIQVVAMLIQLAVAALMPLMPVIVIIANLVSMLIQALIPIIQVVITVAGAFIGFASTVLGAVIGFVTMVLGVFSSLWGGITSIFNSIFGVIRGVWSSIFGFISGIVSSIASTISGVFSGVGSAISGVFSGIGSAVSGVFSGIANVVKGVINGIISFINGAIHMINNNLIDTANKIPFVNIPHIPDIPKLHEGGVFTSGVSAGEGLALLRDNELVVTPEQRNTADDLLRALLGGDLSAGPTTTTTTNAGVQITQHITQLPGESGEAFAARSNSDLVWNLNNGVTRRVGAAAAGAAP